MVSIPGGLMANEHCSYFIMVGGGLVPYAYLLVGSGGIMTEPGLYVSYLLDSTVVTEDGARWLEQIPDTPQEERAELLARLRAAAEADDRPTLHLAGMAMANSAGRTRQSRYSSGLASSLTPPARSTS